MLSAEPGSRCGWRGSTRDLASAYAIDDGKLPVCWGELKFGGLSRVAKLVLRYLDVISVVLGTAGRIRQWTGDA